MVSKVTSFVVISSVFIALYWFRFDNFNPESIKGQRVLVTGSSSGIGEELAYKYAQFGAKLVITGRRGKLLEKVAEKCRRLGAEAVHTVEADMSISADRERLAAKTEQALGGLDVLILNHAPMVYGFIEATPQYMTTVKDMMSTGFLSYVHLTTLLLKSLEQSHGRIGVTSSVGGKYGIVGLTHYNAMKHALNGFFSSLRQEFLTRENGVSVTIAIFGLIGTEQIQSMYKGHFPKSLLDSKSAKPEDAAEAMLRGISTRAFEVVFPANAKVFLFINGIFPQYFENFVNWYSQRLKNQ